MKEKWTKANSLEPGSKICGGSSPDDAIRAGSPGILHSGVKSEESKDTTRHSEGPTEGDCSGTTGLDQEKSPEKCLQKSGEEEPISVVSPGLPSAVEVKDESGNKETEEPIHFKQLLTTEGLLGEMNDADMESDEEVDSYDMVGILDLAGVTSSSVIGAEEGGSLDFLDNSVLSVRIGLDAGVYRLPQWAWCGL